MLVMFAPISLLGGLELTLTRCILSSYVRGRVNRSRVGRARRELSNQN